MKHPLSLALAAVLAGAALSPALAQSTAAPAESAMSASAEALKGNPFASESTLPLQYPHFDRIRDEHFAPAFDAGMAEQLAEVRAIADNPAPPTFENTILPLETNGKTLGRAMRVFFNLVGTDTNDARKKLQADYSAKFAAHRDAISLDPKLFARIKTLHDTRATLGLDAEGVRLVEEYYKDLVRSGAALDETQKARLKEINGELAKLGTTFSQNVLAEVNDSAVVVDTAAELDGLTPEQIDVAATAAKARGHDGKYVITLLNTTGQPPLPQLNNRALRQRVHEASVVRGARGNKWDNREIVATVLKLRAERAKLLGFETYADYVLADETAKSTDAVNAMLGQLAPAAVANARNEAAKLQAMIDSEQAAKGEPTFQLAPWDWAYYTEKVRKAEYDFDESQLKPYFEMKNVLENGVFFAATQLYGITFKARTDLPKYHADTWVYDVHNADGSQLAIFIFDPYARDSKRGGAWMSSYVSQSGLEKTLPVVANHQNIPKPQAGPTLLTWDEVTTMFHEFGHGLHGMFSDVKYPYFSGTSVPRDFVEFPSQVNEMWADWPSILANYAKHHVTGEAMPQALLDKVVATAKFNQGFATTEYLGAAMLDQYLHQLPADKLPKAGDVLATEAAALKAAGLDFAAVPPRYRTTYFSHIMGGYAAGYYAYIWSEVLDANTVAWIEENGGLTRANGDRFRATLLSQGGSKDALQLFTDFSGKTPDIQPLLVKRGLDGAVSDDGAPPSGGSDAR
ncbi:M3 family metallopeptidase [Luteimonas sp. MC1825]|uniref:M3 family metallopeptidase n=1 Tax=Luteimonas sp. MC1825 TaxID=2761107 RepID=UPI00160FF761|nr:M3 family metallopeptidase [Luteimonas sp. MC1825]MBB6598991.1 M3 family metallopeptidase [Luteimonas sp. MC1825]QOC89129.1 M3 family metallopeptidase [Luteimonas sp. MC1825]